MFFFQGLFCFCSVCNCEFSLDFVVEFLERKLVLYRVARGRCGNGREKEGSESGSRSSSKAEPRTIFTTNTLCVGIGVREWVFGLGLFMFICLALMCAAWPRAQFAKRGLLFNIWFLRFPAFALRLCAVFVLNE